MIVIMAAFLAFVFLWTRKRAPHRSTPFLFGLVFAWTVAFVAFLMIVGSQSLFFLVRRDIFPLDWYLLSRLPEVSKQTDTLVTALNVGVAAFYFFFLAFSIAFTRSNRLQAHGRAVWLSIPLVIGVVIFDPRFVRLVSRLNATAEDGANLVAYFSHARTVFRIVYPAYVVSGIAVLLRYTWAKPRLRKIQRSIEMMDVAVVSFAAMFLFFFFGQPQLLAVPTMIPSYTRIAFLDLPTGVPLLRILPAAQVIVLSLFAASIVHHVRTVSADMYYDKRIRHSLRVASLGGKVIGHAMKNQLLAIESELDLVARDFGHVSTDLSARLDGVARTCRRTYETIGRSVALLRAPSLRLGLLDLSPVVQETVGDFSRRHPDIDCRLTVDATNSEVYADRFHLSEVMHNLLRNAAQATAEVERGEIRVSIHGDGRWVSVHVGDNGPGIHEEDLPHLFEPFYSRNNARLNWGVGLTYCHYVIDGHDGKIGIANASPRGAEAIFSLPLA